MEENESKSAAEYIKLGNDYRNGQGVEKDEDIALGWYQKAAELGDGKASLILGDMYNYYYRYGENHEMAFYWYKKAAHQLIKGGYTGPYRVK